MNIEQARQKYQKAVQEAAAEFTKEINDEIPKGESSKLRSLAVFTNVQFLNHFTLGSIDQVILIDASVEVIFK